MPWAHLRLNTRPHRTPPWPHPNAVAGLRPRVRPEGRAAAGSPGPTPSRFVGDERPRARAPPCAARGRNTRGRLRRAPWVWGQGRAGALRHRGPNVQRRGRALKGRDSGKRMGGARLMADGGALPVRTGPSHFHGFGSKPLQNDSEGLRQCSPERVQDGKRDFRWRTPRQASERKRGNRGAVDGTERAHNIEQGRLSRACEASRVRRLVPPARGAPQRGVPSRHVAPPTPRTTRRLVVRCRPDGTRSYRPSALSTPLSLRPLCAWTPCIVSPSAH